MPDSVSLDALFAGALSFWQPARGYRVNVDSLLLAAFVLAGGPARRVVDLGAGVGAVTLFLAHLGSVEHAVAVERDSKLASLCEKNLAARGIAHRVLAESVDAVDWNALPGRVDSVVCNPPFFESRERRPGKPAAESARAGELAPFLGAARRALGRGRGRAAFVYPARSLTRLLADAERVKLVAKRLRLVHALPSQPARVALVELKVGKPGGLVVEPPLFEWRSRGVPSEELERLTGPRHRAGRAVDRT